VKDSKGKSFSKGRMAAQISHVSVMAVNTFLKEESNITKEYVEETRGQMTTVVFKLKSGVSFTQIVKVLDTANKNAVSASASASNPAGKADIFRHVVWNENPEKVDVAMALRPVLYSDYQIVQDELRQLLGLY
jgi:peptidyl-tRNA hydrolase